MTDQKRTVVLIKNEGFDEWLVKTHADGHSLTQNAIGYLSEWNMWANRFDEVRIMCFITPSGPEINAAYKSTATHDAYFICGLLQETDNGTRFTFHS